ncbi:MAG: serine hydrolase domain-containing protein [Chryseotalea sp.]
MKKFLRIFLWTLLLLLLTGLVGVWITFPPVMSGMAAKTVCSCYFVSGRSLQNIKDKELQVFPGLDQATIEIDEQAQTVTASILFNTKKAIYRNGLGCVLLSERSEAEIRKQNWKRPTAPLVNQDTVAWPMGNLYTIDSAYAPLQRVLNEAIKEKNPEQPAYTSAIVIVHKGKIVAERYASGISPQTPLMGWSMTKSITGTLIGMLVKEGKLNLSGPAPVSEWQQDERKNITLTQLLQASSGLDWSETYFNPIEDFHQMFIYKDDKGGYAASKTLKHSSGTFFQYSSGTSNILMRMVRQQCGDDRYLSFVYDSLLYKIGMYNTTLEQDASGTIVGSSYGFATARDWARFGLLYQQNGNWMNENILPKDWVRFASTPADAAPKGEYGAQWWLNAGEKNNEANRTYPALSTQLFSAEGFEGQYVMILPEHELVVVRLGVSHAGYDIEKLVNAVIQALPK